MTTSKSKAKAPAKAKVPAKKPSRAKAAPPTRPSRTSAAAKPKPRARRAGASSAEKATRDELATMPADIRGLAIAATAIELARGLDDPENSLTSKSAAAKAHMEIMGQLRSLAPQKRRGDSIDGLKDKRAKRRSAGGTETAG